MNPQSISIISTFVNMGLGASKLFFGTLIGIVAKEVSNGKYEMPWHLSDVDTFVTLDTKTGEVKYIRMNLGERRPKGAPGKEFIRIVNKDYTDLGCVVIPRELLAEEIGEAYFDNAVTETAKPETDIEDIIAHYKAKSVKEARANTETTESALEPDEDYTITGQNPEGEQDVDNESDSENGLVAEYEPSGEVPEGELVTADEPGGESSESAE